MPWNNGVFRCHHPQILIMKIMTESAISSFLHFFGTDFLTTCICSFLRFFLFCFHGTFTVFDIMWPWMRYEVEFFLRSFQMILTLVQSNTVLSKLVHWYHEGIPCQKQCVFHSLKDISYSFFAEEIKLYFPEELLLHHRKSVL